MAMPIKSKTNEEFNIVPGQFKSKAEKKQYIKEEIAKRSKINLQRAQNITLISSLVKYDTPFLVSSTATNKKTLKDLEENEENALTLITWINKMATKLDENFRKLEELKEKENESNL